MFTQIYVEEKLREIKHREASIRERGRHADPARVLRGAEVPRTGVGLVHEVFRRIAEPEPARPKWRWVFAR